MNSDLSSLIGKQAHKGKERLQLFILCLFPSLIDLSFPIVVVKKDT